MRQLLSSKVLLLVITALSATAMPMPLPAGVQPAQVVTIRITDDINCGSHYRRKSDCHVPSRPDTSFERTRER
jgi:hypothetical protein